MAKLFVGLQIPGHLSKEFNLLKTDVPDARWEAEENVHITLSFIGEVDDAAVKKVELALQGVKAEQFHLALEGIGTFSRNEIPNVLWVGVTNDAALKALKLKIDEALKNDGLPFDSREYRPHMTLAFLENPDREKLGAFLDANKAFSSDDFKVMEFVLFQATGTKDAPVYKKISAYPLSPKP